MGIYKALTDEVLRSNNFIQIIKETKTYSVKSFADFVKEIKALDDRLKKLGITTDLSFDDNEPEVNLKWVIDNGYMNDKNRVLFVRNFENGRCECDPNYRFRAPGSTNLNKLVDPNQILKHIDEAVYALERDSDVDTSSGKEDQKDDADKPNDQNKDAETKDDAKNTPSDKSVLDPSVVKEMERLESEGNTLLKKALAVPAVEFDGKQYKPEKGELLVSTDREVVAMLYFPKSQYHYIYDTSKDGRKLRTAIQKNFNRNGFYGKTNVQFRADMDRNPYLYVPVGKVPKTPNTGPEAEALLDWFGENKFIRFQPKE